MVASAVVDHPLFFHHRENGMLVTADSPAEWVDAIHALLADPTLRDQMVTRARSPVASSGLQRPLLPACSIRSSVGRRVCSSLRTR